MSADSVKLDSEDYADLSNRLGLLLAAELGRQGGLARAKSLSAGERLKIAKRASKAAAAARKKKARERKKEQ